MDEKKAQDMLPLSDEQLNEVTGGQNVYDIFFYEENGQEYYFCSPDLDLAFLCQCSDRPVRYVKGSEPKRFYCEKCRREHTMDELNRRLDMALWRSVRTQQPA